MTSHPPMCNCTYINIESKKAKFGYHHLERGINLLFSWKSIQIEQMVKFQPLEVAFNRVSKHEKVGVVGLDDCLNSVWRDFGPKVELQVGRVSAVGRWIVSGEQFEPALLQSGLLDEEVRVHVELFHVTGDEQRGVRTIILNSVPQLPVDGKVNGTKRTDL